MKGYGVRFSRYFLPTLKETPGEAEIVSHRLMLRAGLIRQSSSGIYTWLPVGFRVLEKISRIIEEEQNMTGAHQLLMPTIQSADLWVESGRYDDYGAEMLRIQDRHNRDMLYGPTNEELITAVFRDCVTSYKGCPQMLYHIQWKFRDEIRPRFGVMRGREFLMKDGYSFDMSVDEGLHSYRKMFVSYIKTFRRMGLDAIPMRAENGPIGGKNSHEFIILAKTGESSVFVDKRILSYRLEDDIDYDNQENLKGIVDQWTSLYASTEEMHDEAQFQKVEEENRLEARGIEVGHIFFFGDRYSKALNALVDNKEGKKQTVQMGSYGIGVSRLAAAIIEACHDEKGICWPKSVSPFHVSLINVRAGHEGCDSACDKLYGEFQKAGLDVLYDDRSIQAGAKFADHDLLGFPYQVIIGPKGIEGDYAEVKERTTGDVEHVPLSNLTAFLQEKIKD